MLVRESISFQRGVDPKNILGIGQSYLIKRWINMFAEHKILVYWLKNYTLDDNLKINVKESVDLSYPFLWSIPEYIKFGIVDGNFSTFFNSEEALKSAPELVKWNYIYYCPSDVKRELTEKQIRNFCKIEKDVIMLTGSSRDSDMMNRLHKIFNDNES